MKIKLRDMEESDISFIIATWIRSCRYNFPYTRVRKSDYFKSFEKVINYYLENSEVKVICNSEDNDQIFGYIVHDDTLHFAYVKDVFRKLGLFKHMLDNCGKDLKIIRNWTTNTDWILKKFEMSYVPFWLEVLNGN